MIDLSSGLAAHLAVRVLLQVLIPNLSPLITVTALGATPPPPVSIRLLLLLEVSMLAAISLSGEMGTAGLAAWPKVSRWHASAP